MLPSQARKLQKAKVALFYITLITLRLGVRLQGGLYVLTLTVTSKVQVHTYVQGGTGVGLPENSAGWTRWECTEQIVRLDFSFVLAHVATRCATDRKGR